MSQTTYEEVVEYLKGLIANEIKAPINEISEDVLFHEFGLDSVNSVFLLEQVESKYQLELTPLYFWDHPNIRLFAQQIVKEKQ